MSEIDALFNKAFFGWFLLIVAIFLVYIMSVIEVKPRTSESASA